jgi:hypothetical protein
MAALIDACGNSTRASLEILDGLRLRLGITPAQVDSVATWAAKRQPEIVTENAHVDETEELAEETIAGAEETAKPEE